ncbi:MAG: hypothetical protein ABH828_01155 [archaeon]
MTNRKVYSNIALWIIVAVSLHIIFEPMYFESVSFYVRHLSALVWSAAYIFLFIYWHVAAFRIRKELKDDQSKKTIILYMFAVADVSFILSIIYSVFGYFKFSTNFCYDYPSIWCTFYVVQAFIVPFFFMSLPRIFKRPQHEKKFSEKNIIIFIIISVVILLLLISTLPFFDCLAWKFVFP